MGGAGDGRAREDDSDVAIRKKKETERRGSGPSGLVCERDWPGGKGEGEKREGLRPDSVFSSLAIFLFLFPEKIREREREKEIK